MHKYIKYALLPLVCLLLSCGKKAPNIEGSEVKDAVLNEALIGLVRMSGEMEEGITVDLTEIINLDSGDALTSKLSFKIQMSMEDKGAMILADSTTAVVSYSESDEIEVTLVEGMLSEDGLKAFEKEKNDKDCIHNQWWTETCIESYTGLMHDLGKKVEKGLSWDVLIEDSMLKEKPVCLNGGTYTLSPKFLPRGESHISCSCGVKE